MVDYGSVPVYIARRRPLIVPALPTDVTISDCMGLVQRWPMSAQRWCSQHGIGCLYAMPVSSLERYHPLMWDWCSAGTYCTAMVIIARRWFIKLFVLFLCYHPILMMP